MKAVSSSQEAARVLWRHFKFYLSRRLNYPLVEPDMLQLCFLFRCNLRCAMCSMRERAEKVKRSGIGGELSLETIQSLITQARGMGIRRLFLLGGEPFLRADLFDMIVFARANGIQTIVSTNGTLLDNAATIEKTIDSGLEDLIVSIDGACDATFGAIRGSGTFEKIKANIRLLNEIKRKRGSRSPNITFFCTIMNQNIAELLDIVHLAKELGAAGIGFQPVVKDNTDARLRDLSGPNWVPADKYAALDAAIEKLVDFKLSHKDNRSFISPGPQELKKVKAYFRGALEKTTCYLGFSRIVISQDGKMYFCAEVSDNGQSEVSFGDVRKNSLRELWYSSRAAAFRKNIKRCSRPCLLGCTRRGEFDRFLDTLQWHLHRPLHQ